MKIHVTTVDTNISATVISQYPCLEKYGWDDGCININSLEELLALYDEIDDPLIIYREPMYFGDNEPIIEIYDDYRE